MEVRGVEPRSETVNLQASTCLVATLNLAEQVAQPQALFSQPAKGFASGAQTTPLASLIRVDAQHQDHQTSH